MKMNNCIEVFAEGDINPEAYNIDSEKIKSLTNEILTFKETDSVNVSIILTDNETIQEVNRDYRKKDYPTDVISFAYREEVFPEVEGEAEELGDIYISLEKTQSQSVEYGVTFHEEFLRLLIHGILHLLGYDHETSPEDEKVMLEEEERILNSIS